MLIWNRIASLYPQKEILIFIIFIFVFEIDLENYNSEALPEILNTSLKILQKDVGYLKCFKCKKSFELVRIYFEEEEHENGNVIKLKKELKNYIEVMESFMKEKELAHSFENNAKEWFSFVKGVSSDIVYIPPELHPSNKVLIFMLICLFKPTELSEWAKRQDTEGLLFKPEQYQLHLHNNVKSNFYKINEISYQSEWVYLWDRLYFQYHNLASKEIFLPNHNIEPVISFCQNYKINYTLLDASTLLWRMDKCFAPQQ